MDGDRYRSRTLPSTHATWKERRAISRILRRRDGVMQGVPNLNTKVDVAFFVATSMGLFRKPLRVSLLAAADTRAEPWVNRIFAPIDYLANRLGRGRSEEHTSELQSLMRLSYAVFSLKNKNRTKHITHQQLIKNTQPINSQ